MSLLGIQKTQGSSISEKLVQMHSVLLSNAHSSAKQILEEATMERLEKRVDVMNASHIELTQKVIRTAYYIAKNHKPYSDHPDLIELQTLNGANLGMCLYSRSTATVVIDMIASEMCRKICNRILEVNGKISILVDESTTISNKTTLIVYIKCETSAKVDVDIWNMLTSTVVDVDIIAL